MSMIEDDDPASESHDEAEAVKPPIPKDDSATVASPLKPSTSQGAEVANAIPPMAATPATIGVTPDVGYSLGVNYGAMPISAANSWHLGGSSPLPGSSLGAAAGLFSYPGLAYGGLSGAIGAYAPLGVPYGMSPNMTLLASLEQLGTPAWGDRVLSSLSSRRSEVEQKLASEVEALKAELTTTIRKAKETQADAEDKNQQNKALAGMLENLREKESLGLLVKQIDESAFSALLSSTDLRKSFLETPRCVSYVISIDIRRSTELMLKARDPKLYAQFITTLCTDLMTIVTKSLGVFDKFTGDGILAFYPDFFSGQDAGFRVIETARRCLDVFHATYKGFRSCFNSVLSEVGLGIGIDYGETHLVRMGGGITVVGAPVVYACRLASAPAGTILLNQPAYEKLSEDYASLCSFRETQIPIKYEGQTLAYEVNRNGRDFSPRDPQWKVPITTSPAEGTNPGESGCASIDS